MSQFEVAVDAIINGDLTSLRQLLSENPTLVHERSARPHRATLLHYNAANGVEDERQKSPANAPEIARLLLEKGAEVDALAEAYAESCSTMSLLVSSVHPAKAGVQVALVDTLLDFGAQIEGTGTQKWGTPLLIALAFGYLDAAEALAQRGARVENVAATAGLGRLAETAHLLPEADSESRYRAQALAVLHGHTEVVSLLLDAGEDPNRYTPEGNHAHSTPLHQAIYYGHLETVKLLEERGARLDMEDTIFHSTPLGWAIHAGQAEIEAYLRTQMNTSEK